MKIAGLLETFITTYRQQVRLSGKHSDLCSTAAVLEYRQLTPSLVTVHCFLSSYTKFPGYYLQI
jgi:hypothetical protein